jgi:hypothetical protein
MWTKVDELFHAGSERTWRAIVTALQACADVAPWDVSAVSRSLR